MTIQRVIFLPFNPGSTIDGVTVDAAGDFTKLDGLTQQTWRLIAITTGAPDQKGVYALIERDMTRDEQSVAFDQQRKAKGK